MIERIPFSFKRVINSFLRWNLVVHVAKDFPRTVVLLFSNVEQMLDQVKIDKLLLEDILRRYNLKLPNK